MVSNNKITLENDGMTVRKKGGGNYWHLFGTECWTKGIHRWELLIEKYGSGWLSFGIIPESEVQR